MTISSSKFRNNPYTRPFGSNRYIPCGTVIDSLNSYDIVFLQDYKSTFAQNMPPTSYGIWEDSPQILDFLVSCMSIAWPNSYFGLAHFSDYPIAPYGVPDEDFVYQEIVPLTPANEISPLQWSSYAYSAAQHDGNWSVNGGDLKNCALDAIDSAINSTTIGWRNLPVGNLDRQYIKIVVILTDQLPHDSGLEQGVPHTSSAVVGNNMITNSIRPIYILINDDYASSFTRYTFTSTEGIGQTFRTSDLYEISPAFTLTPNRITERIITNMYKKIYLDGSWIP
jgi:hypothetical protein